jgi:hypothetical protein
MLCYPKVTRWSGQATPRCHVLLQWGRTRAGAGITQTGLPGSRIREETQVTQTGLPGLAVQISSGQIMQNKLCRLETRASNSWVRASSTWITQIRSEMRGSSGRITQIGLLGLRQAEIFKKLRVLLTAKGQLHDGARGVLQRHRGVGCRGCVKESCLRRGRKSNWISSLTG